MHHAPCTLHPAPCALRHAPCTLCALHLPPLLPIPHPPPHSRVFPASRQVYQKAARKLCERSAARFERAARAALPAAVARGRAAQALPRRSRRLLLEQMRAVAQLHEAEAADLPPRACDVDEGPDPLWKQALRQVVGLAFNGAQFYLLQYLPAKRADRKAERQQPRGPLF